jgi:predicted glycosyltransferase
MIETRQSDKYVNAFHANHPDAFIVKSVPFSTLDEVYGVIDWLKENVYSDVLTLLKRHSSELCILILYCDSEQDATAVKLRWG